jgi:hypothetical protein
VSHVAIVGLRFLADTYTGVQDVVGIQWNAPGDDVLLEDNYISGYGANIVLQPSTAAGTLTHVQVRRNIIADAYRVVNTADYSQGLFVSRVATLLVEENVIDHNGWNAAVAGTTSEHNHNIYLQVDNTDITVRGNVIARAGATGLQQRPGGLCEENLFLQNPIAAIFGHAALNWPAQKGAGTFRNNVATETRNIDAANPRGIGFQFQNVSGVDITNNVVAHHTDGTANTRAYLFDTNLENVSFHNNIAYDWVRTTDNGGQSLKFDTASTRTGLAVRDNDFQQPVHGQLVEHVVSPGGAFTYSGNRYFSADATAQWFRVGTSSMAFSAWETQVSETSGVSQRVSYPDASRTIGSYHATLGRPATLAAFLDEARLQAKGNWRAAYTAAVVNAYIRSGFGR